jgi:hypothetical protein
MTLTHLHLVLNHIPIVGTLVAGVIFVIALRWRNPQLERLVLGFLLVFALLTIPVYLTGEPAEHVAERLPGVAEAVIDRHEDAALAALVAVEILGASALAGLALFRQRLLPRAFAVALVALIVVTTGLFGWTGYLGGQIRHTEIRTASPALAGPLAESKRHWHDD